MHFAHCLIIEKVFKNFHNTEHLVIEVHEIPLNVAPENAEYRAIQNS